MTNQLVVSVSAAASGPDRQVGDGVVHTDTTSCFGPQAGGRLWGLIQQTKL